MVGFNTPCDGRGYVTGVEINDTLGNKAEPMLLGIILSGRGEPQVKVGALALLYFSYTASSPSESA